MKTPLCSACLKSEFLCNGCNKKVEQGELTKKAVEILRHMHEISSQYAALRDVTVNDVISYPEATILVVRPDDVARVIGKNGRTISQIASFAQKPVKVVPDSSIEESMRSLIHPAQLLRISTVYTPDSTKKRATIAKEDEDKIQIPLQVVTDTIAYMYNASVEIAMR